LKLREGKRDGVIALVKKNREKKERTGCGITAIQTSHGGWKCLYFGGGELIGYEVGGSEEKVGKRQGG